MIALARSTEKGEALAAWGVKPSHCSLFDSDALSQAMAGCDAAVNLATSIPPTSQFAFPWAWRANEKIRHEGSAAFAKAAAAAGVARLVQESVSMMYQDAGNRWVDETWPTDRFAMASGNHAAERSVASFETTGGSGVVLRFGWFYGPGAAHSEEFFQLARTLGVCVQMGAPQGYLSSIHMEDAGQAVADALTVPAGVYNVVDDEPLTKKEYAQALAEAAGRRFWIGSPGRLALLFGARTTSLTRSVRASNQKFRLCAGWSPRYASAREGWLATARTLATLR